MPLPITLLDDRRFDDLVAEARQRLVSQLPELNQLVEGDPLYALTDLMAWMTETIIYRANLIPERQRQAFLNLLHIPMRPAIPAKGLVSIHSNIKTSSLPDLIPTESRLSAGNLFFSTQGEVQPTPLSLRLMIKETISQTEMDAMGISLASLRELYGVKAKPFRPRSFNLGKDIPNLALSLDKKYYVLLHLNDKKLWNKKDEIREKLAGQFINIGLAPVADQPADIARELPPRKLKWHLLWQNTAKNRSAELLPLEVISDTSLGCRQSGVVRIKIPKNFKALTSEFTQDPKFSGMNNTAPESPVDVDPESVMCWLCLTAPDDPNFELGFMAINAVEVIAQEIFRDQVIGVGDGRAGQVATIKTKQVDPESLNIEVSEQGAYVAWRQVANFSGCGINDRVYQFDSASGSVVFGDGIRGMRPAPDSRIRAAYYRAGGGTAGNLAAGSIKQILSAKPNQLLLQQDWPTSGGLDAETVAQAEKRIPAELRHRDRAVTQSDFIQLAEDNPIAPVGRAEIITGLMPGNSLEAIRFNVPGVVSLFVMPPAEPAFATAPKPTAGLLADVFGYIEKRKMLGTELYVLSPQFIPVAISLSVEVIDNTTLVETFRNIELQLLNSLWPLAPGGINGKGWPMGRELDANELRTIASRTNGVLAVNHLRLFYQNTEKAWIEIQKLPLLAYQLPELMAVQVEEGEQQPSMPEFISTPSIDDAIAVPVIPDFC
jgi:predicted phage baseplate assembly protein